ncbi:MAG: hypothetical protein WDK96_00765 [Candidatus Paceibacterota bacterium]
MFLKSNKKIERIITEKRNKGEDMTEEKKTHDLIKKESVELPDYIFDEIYERILIKIDNLGTKVEALKTEFKENEKIYDELEKQKDYISNKIDAIEEQYHEKFIAMPELKGDFKDIEILIGNLGELTLKLEELTNTISLIKTNQLKIEEKLDYFETAFNDLKKSIIGEDKEGKEMVEFPNAKLN